MDNRFSLSLKQLLLILAAAVTLTAVVAVVIFYLGQQSGLRMAGRSGTTPTASMPPLPKAMTATPRPKETQTFVFTEQMLNEAVQSGAGSDDAGQSAPISVDAVHITPTDVSLDGQINYLDYQGAVSATGQPYLENRQVRLRLTDLSLVGQPLPALLYPAVEEQINLFFEQMLTGYDVEDLLLEDGQMTVEVTPW